MYRLLILTGLSVGLTACAPYSSKWSPAEAPKQVETEVVSERYAVKLTRNGKKLALGEREELHGFLAHLGDLEEVEFSIRRTHKGLSNSSLKPVERELIKNGALASKIIRLPEIGIDYHGHWADIEIIAKRYVAIAPNCPDWSHSDIGDWTNKTSSNFGCANAAALALSVADPKDLARGRALANASGIGQQNAVTRYEEDRVKELQTNSTLQQD